MLTAELLEPTLDEETMTTELGVATEVALDVRVETVVYTEE